MPHGHFELSEPHLGMSSYGALEWRQAMRHSGPDRVGRMVVQGIWLVGRVGKKM